MEVTLKGVLTLRGKRITGYHLEEAYNDMVKPASDNCIYVDSNVIESLKMRQDLLCYYEDGQIKDLTPIIARVDKVSIEAGTKEFATYTLETDEPTEFTIVQATGNATPSVTITREPIDGAIELELDSKVIGEVRVFAISETKYANTVSITVM